MHRESVIIDHRAITATPASHRDHVAERNQNIGRVIANNILHIPYGGIAEPSRETYSLHGGSLTPRKAAQLAIAGANDLYGAVVTDAEQIHKSMFHPSISGKDTSSFHSADLARGLEKTEAVLPGVTAFRPEDLVDYLREMQGTGKKYRLKIPNASDGEGQHGGITTVAELRKGMQLVGTQRIGIDGIVLEEEIIDPQTISVGSVVLGGEVYSFHLRQKDEVIAEGDKKRTRYLGAENIVVSRGSLSDISLTEGSPEEIAREKAATFEQLYQGHLNPTLSRWSVDVVMNDRQAGITDLTAGRVGGTDPGLVLAVRELHNDPKLKTVTADVTLDYGKQKDVPEGAWVFINKRDLRAYSSITSKK